MFHSNSISLTKRTRRGRRRAGGTMVELMISAMVLMAVITFVMKMLHRIDGVWKDTGRHRAAMCELTNRLEELTLLPADELAAAITTLQPSAAVSRTLPEPVLTGQVVEDELGPRLVLRIDWQRKHPAKPIEMAAWLHESKQPDSIGRRDGEVR